MLETKSSELAVKVKGDVSALKSSVDEFKAEIACELKENKEQFSHQSQRLDDTEDDIERIRRSYDLRVTGFPAKENENLMELFKAIATEIGYVTDSQLCMPSIERIPVKNKTTGAMIKSSTMLMHFTSLKQKQSFYSHYLYKMPLKPEKFGISTANQIVIGENLTKKNTQLFKQAQTMKKNGLIAQTYTEDGLVKIRIKKAKANRYTP